MEQIAGPDAVFEEIAGGKQFTEGPVWLPGEGRLVFSDIPANTMYAWSEAEGVSVFRAPSHNTNGNTVDRDGRLISCEHGSRRVTRT
ncbi:MAG: gluconolactonase, partial [Armatimonadetes bacterium CG_4_10_14_3_um_filter_66_18]